MPLKLPNLDDRTYADLVEEVRRLIPAHAPEWTNHNSSDPGITLTELFAYLTEMLIYRLNRVTDTNVYAFLKLIKGPEWEQSKNKSLVEEIRDTVLALRQPDRAVTCKDFEDLALDADQEVARARCIPRRNIESENLLAASVDNPGHVSIVIVPHSDEESNPLPTGVLIQKVKNYLEPRRLLTTRVHVVGPRYCTIGVRLTLVPKPDALGEVVHVLALDALRKFLHPLIGGPDGKGWPFGRNVYVSEIYDLLDRLSGVDYVKKQLDPITSQTFDELTSSDANRLKHNDQGELEFIEIEPDELVNAQIDEGNITVISPEIK